MIIMFFYNFACILLVRTIVEQDEHKIVIYFSFSYKKMFKHMHIDSITKCLKNQVVLSHHYKPSAFIMPFSARSIGSLM